jgi:putative ABC transport system permease protein
MLKLKQIIKNYIAGDNTVRVLKGIDLEFRESEFVSILGPSGCGKTTLLNIIGGLDRYTSGDLVIKGISTREYRDVDWDIYRNNSIGFVFQSYNLIAHQTVLSNVELALTLAGVSKNERRRRAMEVLEKVGLGDQLHKKPNQMSGGQMQRVAIARALVNNPDILLADEPTGAIDSETSLQIMDILKDISRDRLVIMVTHNAELVEKYSTRIIRLLDGKVVSDSNPYSGEEKTPQIRKEKKHKVSMNFFTALSLSFNNLMTKKTRSLLISFAGSIGIIGIALIISLSSGVQAYINNLEKDTLSTYPIEIQSVSTDLSGIMSSMTTPNDGNSVTHDLDKVYSSNVLSESLTSESTLTTKNDLEHLKSYLESSEGESIVGLTNSIQYGYDLDLQIYKSDTSGGILQLNPSSISQSGTVSGMASMNNSGVVSSDIWTEMIGNNEVLSSQYDVIAGSWPAGKNEVVLVLDKNNEISDTALYSLGILDQSELTEMQEKVKNGEKVEEPEVRSFTYSELLQTKFKLILNTDYYQLDSATGIWVDKSEDDAYMTDIIDNAIEIKIAGIIRPKQNVSATAIGGSVGYTSGLTDYVITAINDSDIVKAQKADPDINVFTGLPFDRETAATTGEAVTLPVQGNQIKADTGTPAAYADNLSKLGVADFNNPGYIRLYPVNFDAKENITALINDYNTVQKNAGHDEYVISYSDTIAIMISSVTSIIDIISNVLIAFISISLVVSSLMIGIITYISVMERTKEIGILRSIGASKKDISRVFNAETVIIGLSAGIIGVVITVLLNFPVNLILESVLGIVGIASLPVYYAIVLIVVSVLLTVIAGLIPSRVAAKKDPVEALRTE